MVLHVEPDGRVRVLFPVDPGNDSYVCWAGRYEIMGRGTAGYRCMQPQISAFSWASKYASRFDPPSAAKTVAIHAARSK